MRQTEIVNLEDLLSVTHQYRKFIELFDFSKIDEYLSGLKSSNPHEGYGIERLFRCLLLQHLEDLSDKELERFICENTVARWVRNFSLSESTPDHTVFGFVTSTFHYSV